MIRIPPMYRELWKLAKRQKWKIEKTEGGHLRWIPPEGEPIVSPSTSKSLRGLLNFKAKLRQAGLKGMR